MKIAVAALCAALLIAAGSASHAQTAAPAKQTVRSAADLPRYTYPISGTATELLHAAPPTFDAFAAKVRADIDATLAGYDVADHATLRELLGDRARAAGPRRRKRRRPRDAAAHPLARGQARCEAAERLRTEAILDARKSSGSTSGDAFLAAFARDYRAKLAPAAVADRRHVAQGIEERTAAPRRVAR